MGSLNSNQNWHLPYEPWDKKMSMLNTGLKKSKFRILLGMVDNFEILYHQKTLKDNIKDKHERIKTNKFYFEYMKYSKSYLSMLNKFKGKKCMI